MEEKKYGIDETMDLVEYAAKVVKSLKAHKSDDGKIDGAEIASTLVSSAPAAVSALVGSSDISEELKDLSSEERDKLVAACLPVVQDLVSLFIKLDAAE